VAEGIVLVHGIFAVTCVVFPGCLGFSARNVRRRCHWDNYFGILVRYFIPVCILSFLHFKRLPAEG
jgi:hypothetical protein